MGEYGQFCSMARAHALLGGRWTLLVARELLCGSRRFNQIRRGIPRISRTVLSERLDALVEAGAVVRLRGAKGPEYALTDAGKELLSIVSALAIWGQRWLPRRASDEDLDFDPLFVDMQRRVRFENLPGDPFVIRFEINSLRAPRYLLLRPTEASLCGENPGFPEPLTIGGPLAALVAWWRGDATFAEARRLGLVIEGKRDLARDFPTWFDRYLFADVAPAAAGADDGDPARPRGGQ
jgi:DNA-binding HxlR family transcriptional regulator